MMNLGSAVTAYGRRIDGVMLEQGMTSTYARKRFKPHRTRVNKVELANLLNREFDNYTPHTHLASDLMYVRVGGVNGRMCACWSAWRTGASPTIPPDGPGTGPGTIGTRHARLLLTDVSGVSLGPERRVLEHKNRRTASCVRHQAVTVMQRQPVRQRHG
jgi:hypothetical protein